MRIASYLIVMWSIVACGDGHGVDIDTNADNACDEIAEVACHNLYQCCTEGEIENFLRVDEPRTEIQCRDDLRRACSRSFITIHSSLEAGRVRFDPETMNRCLSSLVAPEGSCGDVFDTLPWTDACMESAWVGTVAAGGECRFAHDCAGTSSTCGPTQRCAAKPIQGQPCGLGCADGFYCAGTVCQQRLPQGAPCATGQCAEKLVCDFGSTTPTCIAPGGAGAMCQSPSACLSNQCIPGACSTGGNMCYRDTDCPRRCSNSPAFCSDDFQCGNGQCSTSLTTCSFPSDCNVGETCNLPGRCLASTCAGDRVCTTPQFTVDYCEDATREIPGL